MSQGRQLRFLQSNPVPFCCLSVGRLRVRIVVDDPDALFEEYRANGVLDEATRVRETAWGTREFGFRDRTVTASSSTATSDGCRANALHGVVVQVTFGSRLEQVRSILLSRRKSGKEIVAVAICAYPVAAGAGP
jgi:hypothetical protein